MSLVRVAGFSISIDGFGAGPEQSLKDPLGKRGLELHQWFFGTRTFRAMTGEGGGSDGTDDYRYIDHSLGQKEVWYQVVENRIDPCEAQF